MRFTRGDVRDHIVSRKTTADLQIGAVGRDREVGAAKGTAVIPVLNQYKSIGCSPGKHPDTRTTATGSDDDSRDSVHGRRLCIAA